MTQYFKRIDLQGCWDERAFTGTELKEHYNELERDNDRTNRVIYIKDAVERLLDIYEFDCVSITKEEYIKYK